MAVGANIKYSKGPGITREFMRHLRADVTNTPVARQAMPARGTVSYKKNATAPTTNAAADIANNIGDYCIHYNASNVFQDIYMCTAGNLSSTCTWTKLVD